MRTFRTILVATDFSETATAALDQACWLAPRLGARVVLLHAYEIPIYGLPDGAIVASAETASRILDAAEKGLGDLVARARSHGVEITTLLRQGPVETELQRAAVELQADLVVVGTHGRRGIAHALLGSMAEKILRTSTVPVMTVGPGASEAGAGAAAGSAVLA